MSIKKTVVLTDSACDLPSDMAAEHHIDIVNFSIAVDGKNYTEREDFTFDEYYDILRQSKGIPATSHIPFPQFLELFENYAAAGVEQLLYVAINSGASNTYNAAQMAKDAYLEAHPDGMEIFLVDSRTYSMAYGWFVAEAAQKLRNAEPMQAVVEWLNDRFARVEIYVGAYSLRFIKKSGRITAAAAFAGELLGLRPIISLVDGESTVVKKVRGDKEVIPNMVKAASAHLAHPPQYLVGCTDSTSCADLAAACEAAWQTPPLAAFKLGAAVATNTGPDTLGLVILGNKRAR